MRVFLRNIFIAFLSFVSLTAAEDVKVLKKHSYYNTTKEEIVLYDVKLEEIELEAFKDMSVNHLQISKNPLEILKRGVFVNVSTHQIYMFDNNISTIEPGTFYELHPLDQRGILMLSLSYNKLGAIRRGIFNNTKFRKLSLAANKIKYIEPGSFDGMVHLFELSLDDNLLDKIDVGIFQNLAGPSSWVQLSFNQNLIKFIDPYAFENTTLFALDLQENQLGALDPSYFKKTSIGSFYV